MEPISLETVVPVLERYSGRTVYLHLETTAGAYTAGGFGAFLRNAPVHVRRVMLRDGKALRVGIETDIGFVYAEGVTHWQEDPEHGLRFEGHDDEGRITVCCELSPEPLPMALPPKVIAPVHPRKPEHRVPAPTEERAVLLVYGHPDDETFGSGGAIALYTQAGVPVTCVTVTLGQMGRNLGLTPFATRETLWQVREKELRNALDALGVGDLHLLGVWDKTSEFRDIDAITDQVAEVMELVHPSLVMTSHPVWGGHPDHCTAGRAALRAIRRLAPDRRPRVQCGAPPWVLDQLSEPPVVLDITPVADIKLDAIRAHRSQSEGMLRRFEQAPQSEEMRRRFHRETYVINPATPD